MKAIHRMMELLAASAKHERYAGSLTVGSTVAVAQLKVVVVQDLKVVEVGAEQIKLDDGNSYTANGQCDASHNTARFIVEPIELSREQSVHKSLRKELEGFPWKELTVEQLDAVSKYARMKHAMSPRKKKAA